MKYSITGSRAVEILHSDALQVIDRINEFTSSTFKTRGGRLGSGMGSLLEALWVYYMNNTLYNQGGIARECELAWLTDHEPADFACLLRGAEWEPATRRGELFRIEAKSMNVGVEEAKGHFTNLLKETNVNDQLLVLLWSWTSTDKQYSWPQIHDYFLGPSQAIIKIRDQLHIARGGSFVKRNSCPDGCSEKDCTHDGEPLNAAGKRERRTGPRACKPANVDYAANFGGLLRMLKTDNDGARKVFRSFRIKDETIHEYISFIHKNFQSEEINQYKKAEWLLLLANLGIMTQKISAAEANELLRSKRPDYQEKLRQTFSE